MEKTKVIAIKDWQSHGKTTTLWLLLKALLEEGAKVNEIWDLNNNREIEIPEEMPPLGELEGIDYWAVIEWHNLVIVLDSRGDYAGYLESDLKCALEMCPDYIICAIQMRPINRDIWNAFNRACPNTSYQRVCFWTDLAENPIDAEKVKQPTVEAIMKYIA